MSNYDNFPGKGFKYIPGYEPPAGTQAAEQKRRLEEEARRKQEEDDRRRREEMERQQNQRREEESNRRKREQREAERRNPNSQKKTLQPPEKNNYGWVVFILILVIAGAVGKKDKSKNIESRNQSYTQRYSTTTVATSSPVYEPQVDTTYSNSELDIDVKSYGLVNTEDDFLNFRSSPTTGEMNKIASIPKFEIIEILEIVQGTEVIKGKEGNWVKIKYRGTEGYIFGAYLLDLNFDAEYGLIKSNTLSGLSLRDSPKIQTNNKITSIPDLAIVKILSSSSAREVINGREGEWIKVDYKSIEGFVFDAYVERID